MDKKKKEIVLESLLKDAEKIEAHQNYFYDSGFECSSALLKINLRDNEAESEYTVFKDSNLAILRREHAYIINKNGEDFLYLFKNSVPDRVVYPSKGNDRDLFSDSLMRSLVDTLNLNEKNNPKNKENFFECYKVTLIDTENKWDLDVTREYIIENARKNKDGYNVCWHIYPSYENKQIVLNILEHNNPKNERLAEIADNGDGEDIHYLPVEKDRNNWKRYIKP